MEKKRNNDQGPGKGHQSGHYRRFLAFQAIMQELDRLEAASAGSRYTGAGHFGRVSDRLTQAGIALLGGGAYLPPALVELAAAVVLWLESSAHGGEPPNAYGERPTEPPITVFPGLRVEKDENSGFNVVSGLSEPFSQESGQVRAALDRIKAYIEARAAEGMLICPQCSGEAYLEDGGPIPPACYACGFQWLPGGPL